MTYVIAIPTYNRSTVVAGKTLAMLARASIPSERIYLFVADAEQASAYLEAVPSNLYGSIVVGHIGIARQREFIRQYFAEGTHVVSMDDDITSVDVLTADGSACAPMVDLNGFFEGCFAQLIEERLYLWGVYPVRNAFYMKHKITSGLSFLIGVLNGYIVRHTPDLAVSPEAESKEDVEQTLRYFLYDCGVLRYNHVACKTKFNAVGGLGTDRMARNQTAAEYICRTYPEYTTLWLRKNGTAEVKLKRLPRRPPEMRRIGARKQFTDAEMLTKQKTYLTADNATDMQIIDTDCDIYDADTGAVLAYFRRNVLTEDNSIVFHENVIKFARTSNTYKHVGKKTMTNMLGYFDKYTPKQLWMFASSKIEPPQPEVRSCLFNVDYPDKYNNLLPFLREINDHYAHVAPEKYAMQSEMAEKTPFVIEGTVFTTANVNVDYQTPIHVDKGDISDGFGTLTVINNGAYTGAETCLVQYGIGFNLRRGDMLVMDVHQYHANLPMLKVDEDAERLSIICYMRQKVYDRSKGLTADFRDAHLSVLKNIRK